VHPTTISKYNTALQLALIGATTAMPLLAVDVSTAMKAMQCVFLNPFCGDKTADSS
jgi:cardiolipin synthase